MWDFCGKMKIFENSLLSKCSKLLRAPVFLELGSQFIGRRNGFEHEKKLECLRVKQVGVVLCCLFDLVIIKFQKFEEAMDCKLINK